MNKSRVEENRGEESRVEWSEIELEMGFYHSFIRKLSFLLNYNTSHIISLNVTIEVKN